MVTIRKPKLYITRELFEEAVKRLDEVYDYEVWDRYEPPPYDYLLRKLPEYDAVVTLLSDRIDCNLIERISHRTRIISQYAVGYDNIDIECATRKGIYVTNTPGVLTEATADLTFALLLSVARRIVESDHFVRWGEWKRTKTGWHPHMMLGTEVHGKTIGIIGFGRIGREVAKRARGFNMKILYYDPVRAPEDLEKSLNAEYVDLDTLLSRSDFITIHVPLSKETRHMINEDKFKKMKRGAILINTARGGIINTDALVKALEEGILAGAGLDVYEEEPLDPNHPLTRFKNVVLVPHIGSATRETRLAMANLVVDNLLAFARGEVPPTLVNREVTNIRKPGFS